MSRFKLPNDANDYPKNRYPVPGKTQEGCEGKDSHSTMKGGSQNEQVRDSTDLEQALTERSNARSFHLNCTLIRTKYLRLDYIESGI